MANVVFAIAPTQAIVERSFSILSYVFNDRRTQLNEQMLEDILTICFHGDLLDAINLEDIEKILELNPNNIV